MASLSDLYALVDTYLPDTGRVISASDIRACFQATIASAMGQANITVTVSNGAASITDSRLIGKTVSLIAGDGFSKTSGFNQPDGNGTITFTDGTTLAAGNVIIFFS